MILHLETSKAFSNFYVKTEVVNNNINQSSNDIAPRDK